MRTTEDSVREMIERAIELARRFSVWWRLVNSVDFKRYETVVNDHVDFFAPTLHSLFESFAVITYQLFEDRKRKDTISIPSLINDLVKSDPLLSQYLRSLVDQHRPVLKKAFAIRCGVYAHRNKNQPPEEIFSAAELSIAEMETIVNITKEIVASLAAATGVDTKEEIIEEIERRGEYSREDTRLIMEALNKHII